MKKTTGKIALALLAFLMIQPFSCSKSESKEDKDTLSVKEAKKNLDEAFEDFGDALEDAAKKSAKDTKKAVEKGAKKVEKKTEKAAKDAAKKIEDSAESFADSLNKLFD